MKINIYNSYENYRNRIKDVFKSPNPRDEIALGIKYFAESSQVNIDSLSEREFKDQYNLINLKNNFLPTQLSKIFLGYKQMEYQELVINKAEAQYYGEEIRINDQKEFEKIYGPKPWLVIEEIIKKFSSLDITITNPDQLKFRNDSISEFFVKITNNITNEVIELEALSSGEKILFALILSIYKSSSDRTFPTILLLDEIDASLHPSMIKDLLNVIKEIFVNQHSIKVVLATHSPSTVALAPEDSIFQLSNKPKFSLKKITKDEALKNLTFGVPSFSINYENRRQVFVESENDVKYYERIYRKLSKDLIPEISLSFISSGESKTDKNGTKVSNCGQVSNITSILRESGNKFIWGIIDWDSKNESSDCIKVLGNGNRYSIESYLFDPILVSALLFREIMITREDLGLMDHQTYIDIKNLEKDKLQSIANFVIDKVKVIVNPTDTTLMKCTLLNKVVIDIPRWYLHHQGHDLEEKILKTFPKLNKLKNGKEEALKLEIINKVIDDMPELISKDLLEIFKNVQSA